MPCDCALPWTLPGKQDGNAPCSNRHLNALPSMVYPSQNQLSTWFHEAQFQWQSLVFESLAEQNYTLRCRKEFLVLSGVVLPEAKERF